ncbi:MAG TPA: pirin family protein, partial [Thermoanaerobaculia bacterium]|nr:pirin family protein [Thermoanaerobaculia bacterium]
APHPHIGIQTVSWLVDGEVLHQDTLGIEAMVRPRGVNVMTSGAGIAHAEQTPAANRGRLHGVQLWVALPDEHRNVAPSFQHIDEVPLVGLRGGVAQIFVGDGSPALRFSESLGADLEIHRGASVAMPLDARFEHGFMLLSGDAFIDDQPLDPDTLYYRAPGAEELRARTIGGARLLIIGGIPFDEPILMWWNFVARTPEEIARAGEVAGGRFRRGARLRRPADSGAEPFAVGPAESRELTRQGTHGNTCASRPPARTSRSAPIVAERSIGEAAVS